MSFNLIIQQDNKLGELLYHQWPILCSFDYYLNILNIARWGNSTSRLYLEIQQYTVCPWDLNFWNLRNATKILFCEAFQPDSHLRTTVLQFSLSLLASFILYTLYIICLFRGKFIWLLELLCRLCFTFCICINKFLITWQAAVFNRYNDKI